MQKVYLARDSASTAHASRDCSALKNRPSWGGEPVEVDAARVDTDTFYLRTIGGGRNLRQCSRCDWSEPRKKKPGIYLCVWQATRFYPGAIQISIDELDENGAGGGFRIAGPKFGAVESKLLKQVRLDKYTADEMRRYLDKVTEEPVEADVREGGEEG